MARRLSSTGPGALKKTNLQSGFQRSKAQGIEADDRVKRKALDRNKKAQRTFRERQKVRSRETWTRVQTKF